jgi:hypothetical protein
MIVLATIPYVSTGTGTEKSVRALGDSHSIAEAICYLFSRACCCRLLNNIDIIVVLLLLMLLTLFSVRKKSIKERI